MNIKQKNIKLGLALKKNLKRKNKCQFFPTSGLKKWH